MKHLQHKQTNKEKYVQHTHLYQLTAAAEEAAAEAEAESDISEH